MKGQSPMKTRWMGWGPGVAALVLLAGCGAEDPEPQCVVARAVSDGSIGSFATVYTLSSGQNPDQQCAQLKPESLGLQKYYSQDPNARDTVAVRSARLGKLLEDFDDRPDLDASHTPYSVGPFSSEGPGDDHFCDVPTLSPTRLAVQGGPELHGERVHGDVPGQGHLAGGELCDRGQAGRGEVRPVPGLHRGPPARLRHQPAVPREV